jgi:hypothetical protein
MSRYRKSPEERRRINWDDFAEEISALPKPYYGPCL